LKDAKVLGERKMEKLRIGSTMRINSGEEFMRSNEEHEIQLG
jgi:hypothetical protein